MERLETIKNTGAIIFCAGLGTRFKPWTNHHPKALALINGKSLLQRNVEYLQSFGIKDIVINVHHFASQIINEIEKNKGWGSSISISNEEDEVLETGGGLKKAAGLLNHYEHFFAINVDILTRLSLQSIYDNHVTNKALTTLAVTTRKTSRYFLFNTEMQLCGWKNSQTGEEKMAISTQQAQARAFSGISLFSHNIFKHIHLNGKFSLVDMWLQLASAHKITGYDHSGDDWIDVGRPESVPQAELLFN